MPAEPYPPPQRFECTCQGRSRQGAYLGRASCHWPQAANAGGLGAKPPREAERKNSDAGKLRKRLAGLQFIGSFASAPKNMACAESGQNDRNCKIRKHLRSDAGPEPFSSASPRRSRCRTQDDSHQMTSHGAVAGRFDPLVQMCPHESPSPRPGTTQSLRLRSWPNAFAKSHLRAARP